MRHSKMIWAHRGFALTIATSWRTRADSKDLRLQMVAA